MASYFPSNLSPRMSSARSDSMKVLGTESIPPLSPRESRQPDRQSPLSPRSRERSLMLEKAVLSHSRSVRKVVKKLVHDKVKSNDYNLVVDEVLKHLKHHGVTSKLLESLHQHDWDTLHHVLKRVLLISLIRMEVSNVIGAFIMLDSLKDKYHSEVHEAMEELKKKVKEHILDDKLLEELREWL